MKMNEITITEDHLTEAARLLGKQILDSVVDGRQALLLTDQSYLHRLGLGSINRDVNPKWVTKLKSEMSQLVMSRERTVITVCIDLREIMRVMEEQNGAVDFKAIVLDGQHRVTCLNEMLLEYPTMKYDFWLQIYIVSSDIEMMRLIDDFDKRLVISAKDKKTMQDRHAFTEAFLELVPKPHHHRRCITGVLNHKALREAPVVEALQRIKSKDVLKDAFTSVAQEYRNVYETSPPKSSSVISRVVEDTKLYFLVAWEKHDWIYKVLGIKKGNQNVNRPADSFSEESIY